jgi:hypothetical protein
MRFLENGLLRRIFGPKRDEITGDCGKLHNEKLYKLYSLSQMTRMIKSGKMKWPRYVGRCRRREMHIQFWWEIQKERDH